MSFWPSAYQQHAPGIRAFLRRRLRSAELAEDLTQETFVRAMGAEDRIRDHSRLRSYLFRIANNLMLNHRRRPDPVVNASEVEGDLDLDALAHPRGESPDERAHLNELCRRIDAVLDELPPDQRIAFRLGVLERTPYADIGRRLGWSVSKVKINVFRARRRLVEELEEDGS